MPYVALPMAQPSGVEGRLRAILHVQQNRWALTRRALWLGGGCALLALLFLPGLRPRLVEMTHAGALAATLPALTWQAPLPKGTVAAPASQQVLLPNGVQVMLLGFSQNPSRGIPWSTPDGRSGIKPPYLYANQTGYAAHELHREFAVYLDGLRRLGPGDVSFAAMPMPGASASYNIAPYVRRSNSFPPHNLQAVVASLPDTGRGDQAGAFLFGVAGGPWQTAAAKQFTGGGGTSATGASDSAIIMSTSQDMSGPLIVSVADDVDPSVETRIIAVDRHRVTHAPETLDGGGSGTTSFSGVHSLDEALRSYHNLHQSLVTFPGLPLRDVREVRFETRPYQWVLFQNLALYPIITPPAGKS